MGVMWTEDQRKAIDSRNGTLLVSAAAGSGKTAVLVERLLKFVIEDGKDIDKFLMITYTNAAASELRAKIIDALSKKIAENPGNRHLARQMNLVHRANISTIHSYCMQLIRMHGHFINVSSDFKMMDESEGDSIRRLALDELLEEKYEEDSERFNILCDTLISGRDDRRLAETILTLHSKSRSHPNPSAWLEKSAQMYRKKDTVWEKGVREHISEICLHLSQRADAVMEKIKADPALDAAYTPILAKDKENLLTLTGDKSWDELYHAAGEISFARLSSSKGCENDALREWAKDERGAIKASLEKICGTYLSKDKQQVNREIEALAPAVCELCALAEELDRRFSQIKIDSSLADYSDLEHFAVKLLVEHYDEDEDKVVPTALAREISDDFCEIMVDEYQDSNCIQDIIFRAISKDEKNITMVGDLKQSIYRFRLADPTIFLNKYKKFKQYELANDGEARVVNLAKNFRSRGEVLDTCNKYFSLTMSERLGELDYTEREYLNKRDDIPETDFNCESELVVIDIDEKGREDEAPSQREAEAKYLANRISDMHAEGVPYEDMVVLLRSQANRASVYEAALKACGIPCVSEKKAGILDTVEVNVLWSFLQIIDNPLWDVPLVSVLRSPLFAFTADDLACVRHCADGCFYHALEQCAKGDEETSNKARVFIKLLLEFRDLANEMGSDELIRCVLDKTGARGLFGAMTDGYDRISNLNEFYNYAVRYESSEFRGLHMFLNHLADLVANNGDIEGDNTESSKGAVRIMTIHKSKGLEFPIVFLADCNRQFNEMDIRETMLTHPKLGLGLNFRDNTLRYECPSIARSSIAIALKNEMRSEELRVLYVAMTRAKEKLIVLCTEKNAGTRIQKAENSVLDRKVSHVDLLSGISTDMWFLLPWVADPSIFKMQIVREDEILQNEVREEECEEVFEIDVRQLDALKAKLDYTYPYADAISAEGKLTATGIAHESVSVHRHFRRPRFVQKHGLTASEKGIAIHLVMQFIDFNKCIDKKSVEQEIERLYDEEYLTREQYEVIPTGKIHAFFESELGRLTISNKCRREFNFSRLVSVGDDDEALLQGVVDLMIETDDGITIVDFKSDASINESNVSQYKRQLEIYKESLEIILEKPVIGCYLYFIQQGKIIKSEK